MRIDPVPVWKFFDIPENALAICRHLAESRNGQSSDSIYWQRAASFLESVKSHTVDELPERDFDWMLKLRVEFEKNEEIAKLKLKIK
jgi:hypothetical protein